MNTTVIGGLQSGWKVAVSDNVNSALPFCLRRLLLSLAVISAALVLLTPVALAGSPHFTSSAFTLQRTDTTLTVSGKEAGLGDEEQVHVVLSATAQCVNPGGNKPSAANKQALSASGDFPVQSGRAEFELSVTATFQPECSPSMSVEFSNIVLTDTTNGISVTLG